MVFTIKKHIQLTIIAIFLIAFSGYSQTLDSDTILLDSAKVKFHSPTKATLMSKIGRASCRERV